MDVLLFIFGIFGNAFGLFLFLSPMITCKRIIKKRSTEVFSGIPYVMALLNCLLSAWYGLPFVSPHNILVSAINGTGAVLELIYVVIFIIFSPKAEKAKIAGLLAVVLSLFTTVALVSILAMADGSNRKLFVGLTATIFSIVMYGSPLSVVRTVIQTKSVEFMPFCLSLFVFLSGTSWFIYGLLGKDPFLSIPNGFGCVLGAMQLIVYFMYCGKDSSIKATAPEESMEMGMSIPEAQKDKKVNAKYEAQIVNDF